MFLKNFTQLNKKHYTNSTQVSKHCTNLDHLYKCFTQLYATVQHSYKTSHKLFFQKTLHNIRQLYQTQHNLTKPYNTIQHYTKLDKTLPKLNKVVHYFTKLYTTLQHGTNTYNTSQRFTQLYTNSTKLCKKSSKLYELYKEYKTLHNCTKLDNIYKLFRNISQTLQICNTRTPEHCNQLYKNFTTPDKS